MLAEIGMASIAFTLLFTIYGALAQSKHGGQSVRHSIEEAWANIAVGFGINYSANLVVLPLAGLPVTLGGAFWIGCIFTAISVVRSFVLRRVYNRRMLKNG